MKVAAIQFAVEAGQPALNREKAARLIAKAAATGAQLLVLPELWPSGFSLEQLPALAETLRGESVTLLRRLAREHKVFIVGGSIAEKRDGRFYNTVVAINEAGEITAKYRKVHLYPHGAGEEQYFSPGEEWVFAGYRDLSFGLMNCYDAYFPEFARNLCLRGAQLLTVPGAWTADSIERFQILAKARAVENHCFVMTANQAWAENLPAEQRMAGLSLIISPSGRVLAEAGPAEAVLTAELDLAELADLRDRRNSLNDRRNILDELDNSQL